MSAQPSPETTKERKDASGTPFSFVAMEHEIIERWEKLDIFRQSLANTQDKQPYVFYDGPPFATGLPHHGHILGSTLKDVVPRYWTMKGRYVDRRFGWDCHGLPIEQEIDKSLGMSAAEAVAKFGVAGYNDRCRAIVERYVAEWRKTITRLGRWVDFDNDYKTMDAWYMESVWWVVKQLWDKGLIYKGFKVMPVSTSLETVLANFEAGLNYLDVTDPAVTVLFRLQDEDAYLAAWTTTPWTLPSNLAICAHADIDYVKVRDAESDRTIYLAEGRLEHYRSRHPELEVVASIKGRDLAGRTYEPLFDYFEAERTRGAFQVVLDDYVTADEGTGLVHQAPAFGEDDHRVLRAAGIDAFACPVTMAGVFTEEVRDFAGQYVKDADPAITRHLRANGSLYDEAVINHSYPFCWRSDTPLIYRAVPSWFVRVTDIADKLVAANDEVHWVPGHLKEGRMGNWLKGAIDWAISRNRVWGTPLPLWENDVTGKVRCLGSVEELTELTGVTVTDLHREHVDPLTFTVGGEEGVYRRVEEVLDCWFESGSMPYAQLHYPFENRTAFEEGFPAEFIEEGLDQTRGWFYTLLVLAAALFEQPAFRNVIVHGMVLAADGKKMSKSLRNYTPPEELMETFGADAVRLCLMTSGLVRAEEQRFTDDGVRDMVRRALLPWHNAYSFLATYAEIDGWTPGQAGEPSAWGSARGFPSPEESGQTTILDRWILSRLQTLKANIGREMERYRLDNVVPRLFSFIEDLTNWYIRLNRPRFWGEGMTADKQAAYTTLYTTLHELSAAMAPFAPFLADHIYLSLSRLGRNEEEGPERKDTPALSVHLLDYPEAEPRLTQPALEDAVTRMQRVILLARRKREEVKIGIRTPLASLTIVHRDADLLDGLRSLEDTVRRELNVKAVRYEQDESKYIRLYAKPNFPVLGKRLGRRMREVQKQVEALDVEALEAFQAEGSLTLDGETFTTEEINVFREAVPGTNAVSDRLVSIDLDCALTPDLVREGLAREVVNRIQRSRRELGLEVTDRIDIAYTADAELEAAMAEHHDYIAGEVLALRLAEGAAGKSQDLSATIDGKRLEYSIVVAGG
ncbi:MAG: isoleucine--tRNA ligase [Gammaproteobacteria bacterium]|nr:isoleucine--tRNA ligase [Gammaproteobacteria bacterium]